MDLKPGGWPSQRTLEEWRERRRRYIQLYQRKLGHLKSSPASGLRQVRQVMGSGVIY